MKRGAGAGRRKDAPRVIVVGAGFAGLAAVRELHRAGAPVCSIDQNVYSTFQPLLYQVATGGLNPGDVAYPVRAFARKQAARFRLGELAGVDPAAGGSRSPTAPCSTTTTSSWHRGVGRLLRRDRRGRAHPRPVHPARRGRAAGPHHGPAGTARHRGPGQGRQLHRGRRRGDRRRAGRGPRRAARDALDAPSPRWTRRTCTSRWSRWPPPAGAVRPQRCSPTRSRQLRRRGVEVRLSTKISEITADRVMLANGGRTAQRRHRLGGRGVRAGRGSALGAAAGPRRPHRWPGPDLRVDRAGPDLRCRRRRADRRASRCPARPAGHPDRTARRHGRSWRLLAGRPAAPFRYHDKGIMATIGRRSAVVELPHGLRIRRHARLAGLARRCTCSPARRP